MWRARVLFLVVSLGLAAGVHQAQARLGEDEAVVEKRFGPPLRVQKVSDLGLKVSTFKNKDLIVTVTFADGVSVLETYMRMKPGTELTPDPVLLPLSQSLVDAILEANSAGSSWKIAGMNDEDLRYARQDKQALALVRLKQDAMIELRISSVAFQEYLARKPRPEKL